MELKGMTCPNCGSQLHFTEDQEYCFCSHCGTQVYKDNPNKASFTYRTIDEAKIKEAEIRVKELELREREQKRKTRLIITAIIGIFILIGSVIYGFYYLDNKYGDELWQWLGMAGLWICILIMYFFIFKYGHGRNKDD